MSIFIQATCATYIIRCCCFASFVNKVTQNRTHFIICTFLSNAKPFIYKFAFERETKYIKFIEFWICLFSLIAIFFRWIFIAVEKVTKLLVNYIWYYFVIFLFVFEIFFSLFLWVFSCVNKCALLVFENFIDDVKNFCRK